MAQKLTPNQELAVGEVRHLRDQFAAAALTGLLARGAHDHDKRDGHRYYELAYEIADGMIEARGHVSTALLQTLGVRFDKVPIAADGASAVQVVAAHISEAKLAEDCAIVRRHRELKGARWKADQELREQRELEDIAALRAVERIQAVETLTGRKLYSKLNGDIIDPVDACAEPTEP